MAEFEIEIAAFDAAQARAAIAAYGRYGKGVDPKARLNLADCAAYALAKTSIGRCFSKAQTFPPRTYALVAYEG
ncbi:MAG: type II toxin-antitoxin system VapC family toxin [Methylocystis sp.]|uniref:hypothetical protein n=1 Tax=Methylocystis sp. TaxID=1911079 RepID=UPI00395BBEE3